MATPSPASPFRIRLERGKAILMTALFAFTLALGVRTPGGVSTELVFAMGGAASYFWFKQTWFTTAE